MVSKILQSLPSPPVKPGVLNTIPSGTVNQNFQNIPFNANGQSPPFSSIVQTPITQVLDTYKQKEKEEAKHRKELFTLAGPSLLLLGGLSWMLKGLPAGVDKKLFGRFIKSGNVEEKLNTAFSKFGYITLGAGGALLGANGILAGVTSNQPSMITGNILQFIPSAILMALSLGTKRFSGAKAETLRNIAVSATMATGGIFTLGFANEIKNKDPNTLNGSMTSYDMSRFRSLYSRDSNISFGERVIGITTELSKMFAFTIADHARLLKNLPADFRHVASVFRNHSSEHPNDSKLKEWLTKPSADKSHIAALFFYLGALPVLLFSHKVPHVTQSRLFKSAAEKLPVSITQAPLFKSMTKPVNEIAKGKTVTALKWIGMLMANLSLFSIALNRDDLKGKAPLLGVPMAVFGMASGKQFFQGMGNVGESVSNLFYSDMAVNGLETGKKETPVSNIPTNQNSDYPSIAPQAQNQVNPFQSSGLTKRYQISYT